MLKPKILALLIAIPTPALAELRNALDAATGADYLKVCTESTQSQCHAYMAGAWGVLLANETALIRIDQSGNRIPSEFCPPVSLVGADVHNTVVDYLKAKPEMHAVAMPKIIKLALHQRYKCTPGK